MAQDQTSKMTSSSEKTKGILQIIRMYLYIPLCVLIAYALCAYVCKMGIVTSESMDPTVPVGQYVICNRLDRNFDRGDIICFRSDGDDIFKRLIGLPGETVSFQDGKVYIDGILLDESAYLDAALLTDAPVTNYTVPEGSFFVMGDNRGASIDSRNWENPYILKEDIVGVLLFDFPLPFLNS